jgi:hypothetical protein
MLIEKSNDLIGIQTRDLPSGRKVPNQARYRVARAGHNSVSNFREEDPLCVPFLMMQLLRHQMAVNHYHSHISFSFGATEPQFGPWPTSMKLSVSLRFTRS